VVVDMACTVYAYSIARYNMPASLGVLPASRYQAPSGIPAIYSGEVMAPTLADLQPMLLTDRKTITSRAGRKVSKRWSSLIDERG